jgi:hypothetical protein
MHMLVAAGLAAAFVSAATEGGTGGEAARLRGIVREVQAADYRGERANLRRLASELDAVKDPTLAAATSYWKGFALWRRAVNGFNETPVPSDLRADLESAVASFRMALDRQPEWIEAKIGISGCLMNLLFLARDDAAWRQSLVDQFRPMWAETEAQGADNPRMLWLLGAMQFGAPPPWGGDVAKAIATLRRGLEAARREALAPSTAVAFAPTWGAAENLMNLAYIHSRGQGESPAVARAYAEGALAVAPDWHYVRDILLVQIDALRQPVR